MRKDIWIEVNPNFELIDNIKIVNRIFFQFYGFSVSGNRTPDNYYLNSILEDRKGSALSISILYLIVTASSHLQSCGIQFSQHSFVAFSDANLPAEPDSILYFVSPLNKGVVFRKSDIGNWAEYKNQRIHYFSEENHFKLFNFLLEELLLEYKNVPNTKVGEDLKTIKNLLRD